MQNQKESRAVVVNLIQLVQRALVALHGLLQGKCSPRRGELIVGKMAPYIVLTVFEFCFIAFLMWSVFQVPVNGQFLTLLVISIPFFLANLGIGLWISTRSSTRLSRERSTPV